jgi:hypothetical protein
VFATDIHIVYKMAGLQVKAIAAGRITMGDEYALRFGVSTDVRLDEVTSAA